MVTWCLGLKYQVTYLLTIAYILKMKIYRQMKNNTVLVQLFLFLCWLLYLHICRMVECMLLLISTNACNFKS